MLAWLKKYRWIYLSSFLFIGFNIFLITKEVYALAALPFVFVIALVFFLSLEKAFLVITFLVPLSFPLQAFFPQVPFNVILPTEPMIVALMLLFGLKLILERQVDVRYFLHPLSLAILIYLIWHIITSITSTIPLVSIKYTLNRIWYVVVFYFFALVVFQKKENIQTYLRYFVFSLSIVALYALVKHAQHGINNQAAAYLVSHPFFNDHTAYGAILAFYFPIVLSYFFLPGKKNQRVWIFILVLFFIYAIVHSYTRAAWLSILVSFLLWGILKLKIKFHYLMMAGFLVLGGLALNSTNLIMRLEENKTDSSDNLKEHVKSMSNIRTDASNVERLNRWKSAFKMFKEKPVFGFGPGTYMFQYAPFQMKRDRTVISTNYGTWGNAHSEYIGPLAEQGLLGSLSFLTIVLLGLYTGFKVVYRSVSPWQKIMSTALLMGLTTYYTHALLNNFLDTDKAALPFWGFTAILVVFDLQQQRALLKVKSKH